MLERLPHPCRAFADRVGILIFPIISRNFKIRALSRPDHSETRAGNPGEPNLRGAMLRRAGEGTRPYVSVDFDNAESKWQDCLYAAPFDFAQGRLCRAGVGRFVLRRLGRHIPVLSAFPTHVVTSMQTG